MLIKANSFVLRQHKDSSYSYYNGSWEELEKLVQDNFDKSYPAIGHEVDKQVLVVPVPAENFMSATCEVNEETKLVATFEKRRENETAFIEVRAQSNHVPAKFINIILYNSNFLGEDRTHSNSDWEIVSINARLQEEDDPIPPIAMARNFLEMVGGSKAIYTAEEFAKAIVYWSTHTMIAK